MKTNTNLAMIKIDLAYAEMAFAKLIDVQSELICLNEWALGLSYGGEITTAWYRTEDALLHLRRGVSEMKRIIRKKKYAANRKSCGGTRATNRTITGIG